MSAATHNVAYSALTRRYFEHPVNAGVLHGLGVGRGEAGAVAEGTWVRFDVQVLHGIVTAARFTAFGCPHVIAVASWITEAAAGRPGTPPLPEPVPALRLRFELPVEKLGRLLTIEDAWCAAIRAAVTNLGAALD